MTTHASNPTVIYPESDGKPIAENTLQYEWIEKIKGGLEALFAGDPDVFVAGDLLWYPVQGDNRTRTAPDALVAFGRPKGYRGSYLQWLENNVPPHVVFEVLSPGNRAGEMRDKSDFYDRYKSDFYDRFGVEEYYVYNPHTNEFAARMRDPITGGLDPVITAGGWVSPRLGVRFDLSGPELVILRPDGEPFKSYVELMAEREAARTRADRLAERLRALGVDPDAP